MRKITFASLLALLICFTACSNNTTVSIDNPTAEAITVSIDGKEDITIAANECKAVDALAQGDHTMKVNGGEEVKFALSSKSALLNPTKSRYFVYNEVYASNTAAGENTFEKMAENGTLAKAFNDVVIDLSDVDYLLSDVLPKEIDMATLKSTGTKSKIFRDKELTKYFAAEGMGNEVDAQSFIDEHILKIAPVTTADSTTAAE